MSENNLLIQSHRFETHINQLKSLIDNSEVDTKLPTVDTSGGLFGWFDYNVTGKDFNNLTEKLGNILIGINNNQLNSLDQIKEIYETLTVLDKDYMASIRIAIKTLEDNDQKIKAAQKDIQATQKDMELVQKDIKQSINLHARMGEKLQEFKVRLEKNSHLDDIDIIWDKCIDFQKDIAKIKTDLKNEKAKSKKAEKNSHLEDIDEMWNKCICFEKNIDEIKIALKNQENKKDLSEVQNSEREEISFKKLRIAYFLSGGAIGIALIEFILFMVMRII